MIEIWQNPLVCVIYALIIGIYVGRSRLFRKYTVMSITEGFVGIIDYLWTRKHLAFPYIITGLTLIILWIPTMIIASLVGNWTLIVMLPYCLILGLFAGALGEQVVMIIKSAWNNEKATTMDGGN